MSDDEKLPQEDERGSEPPADDADAEDEGSKGPLGNPASDEEALSHRQQEQDPPGDD